MNAPTCTLYREIDALGGAFDPEDLFDAGYDKALGDVLAIMARRGFSEFVEAVPAAPELHSALARLQARECSSWCAPSVGEHTAACISARAALTKAVGA